MKRHILYTEKKKGMALIIVIMITAVLTILGASLLSFSMADYKHSIRETNMMKANYVALAGLDSAAKYAQSVALDSTKTLNLASRTGHTVVVGDGSYILTATQDAANDKYILESVGTVGNVTKKVKLELLSKDIDSGLFSNVVYSVQDLDLLGVNVDGPLQSAGDIVAPPGYTDPIHENEPMALPPVNWPLFTSVTDLNIGNGSLTFNSDRSYRNLTSGPNGTMTVTINGSANVNLVVDTMNIKGDIVVNGAGTGKLFIYVKTSIWLQTPHGATSKIAVFVKDSGTFNVQAGSEFTGYVYAPNASVNMQSAHTTIYGAVICNAFSSSNNTVLQYGGIDPTFNFDNVLISKYIRYLYKY